MITNIKPKTQKSEIKSDCLFKRFGAGVHVIQDKRTKTIELMIICHYDVDVLFIEEDNFISTIKSVYDKILSEDFDKYYEYLGKVGDKFELEVRDK